jgi:hypothetical protein
MCFRFRLFISSFFLRFEERLAKFFFSFLQIDRIGTLEAGKDADVVMWDIQPLRVGARPLLVTVDGAISQNVIDDAAPPAAETPITPVAAPIQGCSASESARLGSFAFTNVSAVYTPGSNGRATRLNGPLDVVVENGVIKCLDVTCPRSNMRVFNLNGGSIIPVRCRFVFFCLGLLFFIFFLGHPAESILFRIFLLAEHPFSRQQPGS